MANSTYDPKPVINIQDVGVSTSRLKLLGNPYFDTDVHPGSKIGTAVGYLPDPRGGASIAAYSFDCFVAYQGLTTVDGADKIVSYILRLYYTGLSPHLDAGTVAQALAASGGTGTMTITITALPSSSDNPAPINIDYVEDDEEDEEDEGEEEDK